MCECLCASARRVGTSYVLMSDFTPPPPTCLNFPEKRKNNNNSETSTTFNGVHFDVDATSRATPRTPNVALTSDPRQGHVDVKVTPSTRRHVRACPQLPVRDVLHTQPRTRTRARARRERSCNGYASQNTMKLTLTLILHETQHVAINNQSKYKLTKPKMT